MGWVTKSRSSVQVTWSDPFPFSVFVRAVRQRGRQCQPWHRGAPRSSLCRALLASGTISSSSEAVTWSPRPGPFTLFYLHLNWRFNNCGRESLFFPRTLGPARRTLAQLGQRFDERCQFKYGQPASDFSEAPTATYGRGFRRVWYVKIKFLCVIFFNLIGFLKDGLPCVANVAILELATQPEN